MCDRSRRVSQLGLFDDHCKSLSLNQLTVFSPDSPLCGFELTGFRCLEKLSQCLPD